MIDAHLEPELEDMSELNLLDKEDYDEWLANLDEAAIAQREYEEYTESLQYGTF